VRRIGPPLALATSVLVLLAAPSGALAAKHYPDTPTGAITDCARNGTLTQHFAPAVLIKALAEMKTVSLQYGDCETVIGNAELAEIAPTGKAGANAVANATSSANGLTGALQKQVSQAISAGRHPLTFDGQTVAAGMSALHDSSLFGALPTPLLIAFFALIATGVGLAARTLRDVVRTRRAA
jgi:hypothetical protein